MQRFSAFYIQQGISALQQFAVLLMQPAIGVLIENTSTISHSHSSG